jgi:hypothetical protein
MKPFSYNAVVQDMHILTHVEALWHLSMCLHNHPEAHASDKDVYAFVEVARDQCVNPRSRP